MTDAHNKVMQEIEFEWPEHITIDKLILDLKMLQRQHLWYKHHYHSSTLSVCLSDYGRPVVYCLRPPTPRELDQLAEQVQQNKDHELALLAKLKAKYGEDS